jgi:hypothetical protein
MHKITNIVPFSGELRQSHFAASEEDHDNKVWFYLYT